VKIHNSDLARSGKNSNSIYFNKMDMQIQNDIKYLVIGDPVAHSLSPQMQNAAFEALGFGHPYAKLQVKAGEFPEFTKFARKMLSGFNITVPHKKTIIPYLDSISREAALAESVNTVTVKDGKLHGDSTDGFGLASALADVFGLKVKGGSFFFIGCGGAVQAAAFHFAAHGAGNLFFANRSIEKVAELVRKLYAAFPAGNYEFCGLGDIEKIKSFISNSEAAIQGASLGLKPDDPMPLPPELLNGICFYDTIYKKTPLLQYAETAGLKTADGKTMLLYQGAKSFEIWTGRPAPVEIMRRALEQAATAVNGEKK
jgi:shikimate dehydrogenase